MNCGGTEGAVRDDGEQKKKDPWLGLVAGAKADVAMACTVMAYIVMACMHRKKRDPWLGLVAGAKADVQRRDGRDDDVGILRPEPQLYRP